MANLLNLSISYTPTSPTLHSSVEVRVNYSIRFSPMERLLASYGLRFGVAIRFYDVDIPDNSLQNDDLVEIAHTNISSAQIMATPANNVLQLEFIRIYTRPDLRGPDDDDSLYWERLRAQVCINPIPRNATEVTGACALTNMVLIDTEGITLLP